MKKITTKSLVGFLSYASLILVGVALIIAKLIEKDYAGVTKVLRDIAYIMSLFVVTISSFNYAKSKRNALYLVVWLIAVALIVLHYVL